MPFDFKTLVAFAIALSSIAAQDRGDVRGPKIIPGKIFGNPDSNFDSFSDEKKIPDGKKVIAVGFHQDGNLVDGINISFDVKSNPNGPYTGQYKPVNLAEDEFIISVTCVLDASGLHYLAFQTTHRASPPIAAGTYSGEITPDMVDEAPNSQTQAYQLAGFSGGVHDGKFVYLKPIWVVTTV